MTIQVGDTVRVKPVTNTVWGGTVGKVGTVSELDRGGPATVTVTFGEGARDGFWTYPASALELLEKARKPAFQFFPVPEPTIAVGDTVQSDEMPGKEGVVVVVRKEGTVDWRGGPIRTHALTRLKHIKPDAPTAAEVDDDTTITPSSGNPYADLDLSHPELRQTIARSLIAMMHEPQPAPLTVHIDAALASLRLALAAAAPDGSALRLATLVLLIEQIESCIRELPE